MAPKTGSHGFPGYLSAAIGQASVSSADALRGSHTFIAGSRPKSTSRPNTQRTLSREMSVQRRLTGSVTPAILRQIQVA